MIRTVSLFDVDDAESFCAVADMTISRVPPSEVDEFCRRWHYSQHKGAALWNYGIWDGPTLLGCVSYNLPTRRTCAAMFGDSKWEWVAHMGRLVCADDAPRNTESRLIAASLKLLREDRPVVRAVLTYAAAGEGHIGYVYQATNALFIGQRDPWHYFVDKTNRRRSTVNITKKVALSRGWAVHPEPGKYRYIYLLGSKTERKEARRLLIPEIEAYPKQAPGGVDVA